MTSQNNPAALRKIAIIFASVCCTATAVGAATPLFAATSPTSGFRMGSVPVASDAEAQARGHPLQAGANA